MKRRQYKHLRLGIRDAFKFSIRTDMTEVNMADGMKRDWRELCLAVTNESDSMKLSSLVQELIEALDTGGRSWRHPIGQSHAQNTEAA